MVKVEWINKGRSNTEWSESILRAKAKHVGKLGMAMVSRQLILKKTFGDTINPYPFRVRKFLDCLLPSAVYYQKGIEIEVVIPSTAKDLAVLNLAVSGVRQNVLNPIGKISIICPTEDVGEIEGMKLEGVHVVDEEDLLGELLLQACNDVAPSKHNGWVRQQAVKFTSALRSEYQGVLILDSDTILLKEQNWLFNEGEQSLAISYEYHPPYQIHFEKFLLSKNSAIFETKTPRLRVSFVTHHQLMQPSVLREFLSDGSTRVPECGLLNWIKSFDFKDSSPASEYHSYGTYISSFSPQKVEYIQWRNRAASRQEISQIIGKEINQISLSEIREAFPDLSSISLHAYL